MLQNGHVVGIVTNGTLTNRLHQLNELLTEEEKIRCTMAFSLHYLELVRLNKLNAFFDNMKFLHNNKFSVHYSLVLCDEYIPYVGEIKKVCMDNIGFLPSVSVVRDVNDNNKIMTSLDIKEYEKIGKSFKSPGFDMQFNLASQKQTGFCYAGDWAFILNFKNGIMQQCQANFMRQNIFENPLEPIQFIPVGNNCKMPWCVCMQFQNYGIIPEVLYPSERECVSEDESTWINGEVWDFIDGKLSETNIEYSAEVKNMINAEYVQLNKKFPTIEI